MCLQPGAALDLALVHLHLRDIGRPDPGFDRLVADLLGRDRVAGPEREPNRTLEQLWLEELWSGRPHPAALRRAVTDSALARTPDALGSRPEDLYALTHTVLYATDMGRRPITPPRPVDAIRADAEAALAAALDAGNLDLTAEILWLWPMVPLPWTPAAMLAWSVLSGRHSEDGFLPGPGYDPEIRSRLATERAEEYVLRSSYHTTLAHGILVSALLSTGRPPRWPSAVAAPGAAESALSLLDQCGSARWRRYLDRAPTGPRDALAPLVLTAALRRARGAHDLPAIRTALAVALDLDLLDAPAPRQAIALLRRAALVLG
jgi:hypothetical protein